MLWWHREAVLALGCCTRVWQGVVGVWVHGVGGISELGRMWALRTPDIQYILSAMDPFNVWNLYVQSPKYSLSTFSRSSEWLSHLFKPVASWFLSLDYPRFMGFFKFDQPWKSRWTDVPISVLPVRCYIQRWTRKTWSGWDVLCMCASVSGMAFTLLPSRVDLAGSWDMYRWQRVGLEE